jgi:acyl-CoA synthetase (AMP-forming)/AMP-acid ligase II
MELKSILSNGIELESSGTTGTPKKIFQTPEKLRAANRAAIDSQKLTKNSRVYTVCKMKHAGGLLAQTLPAYSLGADVVIEDFNAYRWVKEIYKYTHSHLTPNHCNAVMGTKDFWNLDLNGVWITCGSDPITWDIIEAFVNQGATFMTNWGMTEIGPCAINTVFDSIEIVTSYKEYQLDGMTLLGDTAYCDWKVQDEELFVKGDICVYDDWFATGDLVATNYPGDLYYARRK